MILAVSSCASAMPMPFPAALQAIAERSGIGALLADGSARAARRLGRGSDAWAMHVKGGAARLRATWAQDHGPRIAVSPRGARHNRSAAYEADFSGAVDRFKAEIERGRVAAETEDLAAVLDSLILCKFIRKCFDDLYAEAAQLYQLVTGWPTAGPDLRLAGERINNLKKLFNIREDCTRADDTLPTRCLTEPLVDGPGAGERLTREELDLMIGGYYAARGWAEDGLVPAAKLRQLGLDEVGARRSEVESDSTPKLQPSSASKPPRSRAAGVVDPP